MNRQIPYRPAPTGWNTWDVQYHTGWTHLPSGMRWRLALVGPNGKVVDNITWRHGFERLGPHTVGGRYSSQRLRAFGLGVELEVASDAGRQVARATVAPLPDDVRLAILLDGWLTPVQTSWNQHASGAGTALVRCLPPPGSPGYATELAAHAAGANPQPAGADAGPATAHTQGAHTTDAAAPETRAAAASAWQLRFDDVTGVDITHELTRIELPAGGGTRTWQVYPQGCQPLDAAACEDLLAQARAEAQDQEIRTSGWLGEAGQAMSRAVTWNTIYAPDLHQVLTPTSRDFVCAARKGFYGTWAVHAWDTFFTALTASVFDTSYAQGIVEQILAQQDPSGMLPNRVSDERGRTADRSQPPVGALTVLQAYHSSALDPARRDLGILTQAYTRLLAWHDWWVGARTGPCGMLAWGSQPVAGDTESATLDRAQRESGLDDSPMYDDARFDPATHTMDLADVGLASLHIADAEALAAMAGHLSRPADQARLTAQVQQGRAALDATLWDPSAGLYLNRYADGTFSPCVSPTLLYPLTAGVPSQERAAQLADRLLADDVLGGPVPLPSVARKDPGFDSSYWRGRVWAPMAYLALEGLRRYDLPQAPHVTAGLLRAFLREWDEHGHVRENYAASPHADVRALEDRSDGLLAWGGLLGYAAIGEVARAGADGWTFAHPGHRCEIRGLRMAEGLVDVLVTDRVLVLLSGQPLLSLPRGVHVTLTSWGPHGAQLRLRRAGNPTRHADTAGGTAAAPELMVSVWTERMRRDITLPAGTDHAEFDHLTAREDNRVH